MNWIGKYVASLFLVAFACGTADAQSAVYRGFATGHVGATTGGDSGGAALSAGGALSVQEDSGWGAEIDFGFANNNSADHGEADLTTLMVNVNWVKPLGPVHPYIAIGAGTIGVHGCLLPCAAVSTSWDLGLDWGAGARYDLSDVFSLGGDARYFLAPGSHAGTSRPGNFGFWRVAFGATFSWAIVQ